METTANQTRDFYYWVAWAHARRKKLATWAVSITVVGLAVWFYVWNGIQHDVKASQALSDLKPAASYTGAEREPVPASAYLRVANQYPGTGAGARAQLLAAGTSFVASNFKDAQAQFEKFQVDYPDSPWLAEAQLGVAASLEAQGKVADATDRYRQFVDRRAQDPSAPQAKSALARLYLAQGKPDLALKLYQDMLRDRNNDSWTMEAGEQAEELLAAHPELRPKPVAPAPPVAPKAMTTINLTNAEAAKLLAQPPAAAKPAPAPAASKPAVPGTNKP